MKENLTKHNPSRRLEKRISGKFQNLLRKNFPIEENPMVRASCVWAIVSDQLQEILGPGIYNKWFASILPLVVSDNVLILQTQKEFNVKWINQHYQDLIDLLIGFQDKNLSSFFIGPHDRDNFQN